MTEPVTDNDLRQAVNRLFPEASVRIGRYSVGGGKVWHYVSLSSDPSGDSPWTVLGPCETREALLGEIQNAMALIV